MFRPAALATTALATLLSAACGQSLSVEVIRPAETSLGATETLVMTEGAGRLSAQETVADLLSQELDADEFYGFLDHSRFGDRIELRPGEVELPRTDIVGRGTFLRVDVLEWYAYDEEDVEVITDEDGYVLEERWTITTHALALLAFTAVTEDGVVLLHDVEYQGEYSEVDSRLSFDEAIASAASAAVTTFVEDITPSRERQSIPLDDTLDAHAPMLEMAQSGQLDVAIAEMQAFVDENPSAPQGHYNLGAFYDAAGDYDLALDAYADALRNGGESWYARTRTACEQRRAWASELR